MKPTTLLALPLALGLLLAAPAAAQAAPPPNFGQHVSQCAQTMGFGANHNPGMHQGASNWDGMPC